MALTEYRVSQITLSGGGAGTRYSVFRPKGKPLFRSGGEAGGPVALMQAINDANRFHMQGGARRAALLATLDWDHDDIPQFLHVKDWHKMRIPGTSVTLADVKKENWSYPAPLDFTNISVNYDERWLEENPLSDSFLEHVNQATTTGEPGFFFNFYTDKIGRNPCGEMTTNRNNDVCNLGSIVLSNIESISELRKVVELGTKFLMCGSLRADLPYQEARDTRIKSRRIGLGLLGLHEWLLMRNYPYSVPEELHKWLDAYKNESDKTAFEFAKFLNINQPEGIRAIAPTGTIGLLAETTTGIEPLFALAYRLRYFNGSWKEVVKVDSIAEKLLKKGIKNIETAYDLANDVERRISVQATIQEYVDQSISSTVNLPKESKLSTIDYAKLIVKYAPKLKGITFYPDGARGGQPLEVVPLEEVTSEYDTYNNDICSLKGGSCGS